MINDALEFVLYLLRITLGGWTFMKQYVVCITLKTTGSRRNQIPHFILPLIIRCPALFSRIFYPAFYPLSLPHPALPLFTQYCRSWWKAGLSVR